MASEPRRSIRLCPLCGISMVGTKSDADSVEFDVYTCLRCGTVITSTPPKKAAPDRSLA